MPVLAGLAADAAVDVRQAADDAIAWWPGAPFFLQHYLHLLATVHATLYLGDSWGAWRRMAAAWPRVRRSGILAFAIVNVELRSLRARTALAAAASSGGSTPADPSWPRARLLRLARREARRLARTSYLPPAAPFAALVRAGIARAEGHVADAIARLDEAASGFASADMALHQAAAWRAAAPLCGGTRGAELRRASEHWMAAEDVRDPAAMARAVAPSFEVP